MTDPGGDTATARYPLGVLVVLGDRETRSFHFPGAGQETAVTEDHVCVALSARRIVRQRSAERAPRSRRPPRALVRHRKTTAAFVAGSAQLVLTIAVLSMGDGETEEFEHVPVDARIAEMAAFAYWLLASAIVERSGEQWRHDDAQRVAESLAYGRPGLQAVLTPRYAEYEELAGAVPWASRARAAIGAFHANLDPSVEIDEAEADELADALTQHIGRHLDGG